MTYPVEDGCPSFHGDALEDSDACIDDVVEGGNTIVWPLPFFQTYCNVRITAVTPTGSRRGVVGVAGDHFATLCNDLI